MNKRILFIIMAAVLVLLCACAAPLVSETAQVSPGESQGPAPVKETPDLTPYISASPVEETVLPLNDWKGVYTAFLNENFDTISEKCFGGIAGISFIDLDLDGTAELILFDAGASASMGVQFFDIAKDGKVYCVSANIEELGNLFGGGYCVDLIVNANFFDDFKLMSDKESGDRFFVVESGNGAEDYGYRELIRFENDDGILKPISLFYKYEEYELDLETDQMVTVSSRYEREGAEVSADEYTAAYESFFDSYVDLDYSPGGTFIWEEKGYDGTRDSFVAIATSVMDMLPDLP